MNFVILDLEWNSAYSKKIHRYVNEVIEFGAIKVNENFEFVDKFSMLVKPQIGKKLNDRVVSMTHITNDEVFECENSFLYVCNKFKEFTENSIILTWGTLDILTLIDNYQFYTNKLKLPFLKYYCNLQEYCEKALDIYNPGTQLGLKSCGDMIGINLEEEKLHRAYADAELSFLCMKKLYNKDSFNKCVLKVNDEFYRKITFKNKKITDINNPLVDKEKLDFICDVCGGKGEKFTPYRIKNKSIFADYFCCECGKKFTGKLSIKLKYDSVVIKKQILPIAETKN